MSEFEIIEVFRGDETSVNPNIIGKVVREVIEISPVAAPTLDPRVKRAVEIAALSGADVSPDLLRQAGINADGTPIAQSTDITTI